MGKPYNFTKEQVIEAIRGCSTITSTVAKKLNCDWATARKYINKWKETKTAYENERQITIDFAEGKLLENIKHGDMGAIKYFLSKKAKDRNYGDEPLIETNVKTDGLLQIVIEDGEDEDAETVD